MRFYEHIKQWTEEIQKGTRRDKKAKKKLKNVLKEGGDKQKNDRRNEGTNVRLNGFTNRQTNGGTQRTQG